MGISGSDLALTQARFGVMRFGAFRFGDYFPNLVVKINGTDRATKVKLETVNIIDRLNGQPNEAAFTVREGVTVTEGMPVIIALGADSLGTRLFSGNIVKKRVIQEEVDRERLVQVDAQDYHWLLDRRFVNAEYSSVSATEIARDIVTTFVWNTFTSNHVQASLPTIDHITFTNVRPSDALTRLAKRIGAFWYIDENKDLHFFLDESDRFPNPPALTSSNRSFWGFHASSDHAQIRTRIIVEFQGTQILAAAVPVSATSIPIADGLRFQGGVTEARIGTQVISFSGVNNFTSQTGTPIGGTVDTDTPIGSTSMAVNLGSGGGGGTPWLIAATWIKLGDQVIRFTGFSGVADPYTLTGIPASGYGAITADISAGATFLAASSLENVTNVDVAQAVQSDIVPRLVVNDTGAQAALAALEGGTDGIREVLIQDGRLGLEGATERADAELEAFSTAITSIGYATRHQRTRSGRTITVTNIAGVTGDFVIQEVQISGFDQVAPRTSRSPKAFPIRTVTALPIQLAGWTDVIGRHEDSQ